MDDPTRRTLLQSLGALSLLGVTAPEAAAQGKPDAFAAEKERMVSLGMTEAEADCWIKVAEAAGAFLRLPELHPMDKQEVATAFHVVQNKLLSRPTYRAYLEKARAAAGKKAE